MFCPKCGSKDVIDVFCAQCLREEKPLVASFKDFYTEVCLKCGRIHHKGKWHESERPGEKISELLKEHLVFPFYAKIDRVDVTPIEFDRKSGLLVEGEIEVTVRGRASEKAKPYAEGYIFPYKILNTLCKTCSKQGTTYFEGTLQVRNETPEAVKFLKQYMKTTNATIAKQERSGTGTDYYITNKGIIEQASRVLQDQFGGKIVSSARLFSRNKMTSKDIYRVTWFIELPPFKIGDVVKLENDPLLVQDFGKRIRFINLVRGKNEFHEYKEGRWERLAIHETTVSSVRPALRVLHPETFEETKVYNAKVAEYGPGDRINVTVDGNRVYIVNQPKE